VDIHPPHGPIHSWRDFLLHLVTITVGILIALSLEGVRESIRDRALVREARGTIARELADNKKEVDGELAGLVARKRNLTAALQFADDLLKTRRTTLHELKLEFSLADLSTASWQTAERTGALAHMDYAQVQKFARVYGVQDLYATQQRRAAEHLSSATAIFAAGNDPTLASASDLERFRQHVLELRSDLAIEEQLARRLSEIYKQAVE
jgi:hypothetical protein